MSVNISLILSINIFVIWYLIFERAQREAEQLKIFLGHYYHPWVLNQLSSRWSVITVALLIPKWVFDDIMEW